MLTNFDGEDNWCVFPVIHQLNPAKQDSLALTSATNSVYGSNMVQPVLFFGCLANQDGLAVNHLFLDGRTSDGGTLGLRRRSRNNPHRFK